MTASRRNACGTQHWSDWQAMGSVDQESVYQELGRQKAWKRAP